MTTAIAKRSAASQQSEISALRRRFEQQIQELQAKMEKMEAQIGRLSSGFTQAPRPGPLDEIKQVVDATNDLRLPNGNLSATAVATAFGISPSQLAGWLGRSRQALNKTPDADSLQDELAFFERVAR